MPKDTCKIEGCEKPARARRLCSAHYMRWLREAGRLRTPPPCTVDGCDNPGGNRGWCPKHYQRWRRTGDPLAETKPWVRRLDRLPHGHDVPDEGLRLRHRSRILHATYGITHEQYLAMAAAQGNKCALCGEPPAGRGRGDQWLHVDHSHETGRVRALLCLPCNVLVGRVEQHGLAVLADYLGRFTEPPQ